MAVVLLRYVARSEPPEVPFARVTRQTLVSTVRTNGKVEPLEWFQVRAARDGAVARVAVERGATVAQGALLAELDIGNAQAELAAAEARIAEAKAELEMLRKGGSPARLAAIEADLAAARLELDSARRELAALERLAAKQAATGLEVATATERVRKAELRIDALESERKTLVLPADVEAAMARLRIAEADAAAARRVLELGRIRAPAAGVVYRLDVRAGSYLRTGDLVAEIGRLDRLRAVIYVDEPELGRISAGLPVTLTWDAMPGREWQGAVDKVPTQVVAHGNRQVGEVIGIIENTGGIVLPPGANVNAEIRAGVAEGALTVPKEALRRLRGEIGVYLLNDAHVVWRPVRVGTSSITHAEVIDGLGEGDAVALPAEVNLTDGDAVTPVFP